MVGSCRPVTSSPNHCLGDKVPHWLWLMAFICVLIPHCSSTHSRGNCKTSHMPSSWASFMRDPSSKFTFKQLYSPFSEQILWRNRVLNCIILTSSEWDYEKSSPSPKRSLSQLVTLTKTGLQICYLKALED